MTRQVIIDYWLEKAHADLESAKDNLDSGRYSNAIRDAYFACFHALSSVLFKEGKSFRKHKEARSAAPMPGQRTKKCPNPRPEYCSGYGKLLRLISLPKEKYNEKLSKSLENHEQGIPSRLGKWVSFMISIQNRWKKSE